MTGSYRGKNLLFEEEMCAIINLVDDTDIYNGAWFVCMGKTGEWRFCDGNTFGDPG